MQRWFFLLVSAFLGLAIVGTALIFLRSPSPTEHPNAQATGKPTPQPCEPQNTVGKVVLPDCPDPAFPTPRTP
jgi:hypothetical protein